MTPDEIKQLQAAVGAQPTGVMDAKTLRHIKLLAGAPEAPPLPLPNSPPMTQTPELPPLPAGGPELPALSDARLVGPDIENVITPGSHKAPGDTRLSAQTLKAKEDGLYSHAMRELEADVERPLAGMSPGERQSYDSMLRLLMRKRMGGN